MAKLIEHLPPSREVAVATAGVQKPVNCGVRRGVGSKPRAGASLPGVCTATGASSGSITVGVEILLGERVTSGTSTKGVLLVRGPEGDEIGNPGSDVEAF